MLTPWIFAFWRQTGDRMGFNEQAGDNWKSKPQIRSRIPGIVWIWLMVWTCLILHPTNGNLIPTG